MGKIILTVVKYIISLFFHSKGTAVFMSNRMKDYD